MVLEMRFHLPCLALLVCICCESCESSASGSESGVKALCSAPLLGGATVNLDAGTHNIPGQYCVTANTTELTVRGSEDGRTVVECTPESVGGFLFSNITNITLERITIRNCGRTLPSDLRGEFVGDEQRVGILFDHCTNIRLQSVTVDQYCGSGILIINAMGRTTFKDVEVSNKGALASAEFKRNCAGAGLSLIYTDHPQHSTENNTTDLDMVNVKLTNNTLELPRDRLVELKMSTLEADMEPVLLNGASGLFLYTGQLAYHVNAVILDCLLDNNQGDVGAALIIFRKTVRNTRLLIQDTVFTNNVAFPQTLGQGGALTLAFSLRGQPPSFPSSNELTVYDTATILDCTFDGNLAESGGAIFIKQSPQNVTDYSIEITDSTFSNNAALFGSAMRSASLKSTFVPKDPNLFLNDVEVYGNRLVANAAPLQDTAVLLLTGINIIKITGTGREGKHSRFHDNNMSVFLTSNTNIILRRWIEFYNNHGFHGGAITLYDNSILFFQEGSNVTFEGNTAVQSGGAIHADSLGSAVAQTCIIQVLGPSRVSGSNASTLDLSITFRDNFAGESGNSIFGNPLYKCYNIPESSIMDTSFYDDIDETYNNIFTFESTVDNGISNIASSPEQICVCSSEIFNSSECEFEINSFSKNVSVVPGQTFEVYLIPLDRAGQPVSSILSSSILDDNSYVLGRDQGIRNLPGTNSCIATQFLIYGPENGNVTLSLSSSLTNLKTLINVTVERCPPGFVLRTKNSLRQCVCSDFVMDTIGTTCNETTYTIARQEQVWFGLHETGNVLSDVVYVSTCPVGHCNDQITDIDLTIPDHLCTSGRTGLLCGACESGLSTVFGSPSCLECSNAWLAMILVFAVVGVLLVALLFLLDLTVTHGTITGLIFYVNIVSVNHSIFFRGSNHGFLFVFVSLLNLELGYPQCFYDGMNDVVKVGLQYVFPAYLLLICIAIILLSRWMNSIQRLTAKCGIHVLSTIFYLIYSKILRTAIDTFSFATLFSDQLDPVTLWLFDGNIHFFEGFHLFLFLLALVVTLVFLVPYPLYLTLIRVTSKCRICSPQRIKPFLDAYLAPYKDKWRFWFGLRVTILFVVCVVFAIKGTDDPGLNLLIQSLIVLLFMVLQAYCQPFQSLAISVLDLFFLLNYTILSLAATHFVTTEGKQATIVSVLVSLVFVVFCGIIGYHVYLTLLKFETFEKISDKYLNAIKDLYNKNFGNALEKAPSEERRGTLINGETVEMARAQVTRSEVHFTNGDIESVTVHRYDSERYREPVLEYTSTSTITTSSH